MATSNLAAGKSSSGAPTSHNCETHQAPLTKAQKKKLEEQKRAEKERIEAQQREDALKREKADQEELEVFKNQSRVRLDFMHAFGNFSGTKDYNVYGQINIIKDEFGGFKTEQAAEIEAEGENDERTSAHNSFSRTQSNMTKAYNNPASKMSNHLPIITSTDYILIYPVGRHIAFKSVETKKMKFLLLPNEAKEV